MHPIKNILCPVDFSEHSNAALEFAINYAAANGKALHLFHVLPQINYYDWNLTGMYTHISEDAIQKVKDDAAQRFIELVHAVKMKHPKLEVHYQVEDAPNPAESIMEQAKAIHAELIIIGSHGRKGFDRLLMGSVAESVMRHANCDVLVFKKQLAETTKN